MKKVMMILLAQTILLSFCLAGPAPQGSASQQTPGVYDTWVATDGLGRSLPSAEEAGDTRTDKYVGLFYFICHDDPQNGGSGTLIDNSKVFAEGGLFAVWEMLLQDQTHVWGEPYFGYYVNTDEWVYRKHAAMFSALNIDFIFVDLSNSFLHGEGLFILFETWHKIREEGGTTPQIALFCGWRPSTARFTLDAVWERIYQNESYRDLFFEWEGKPLFLGSPADLTQEYLDFFTIRESWVGTGSSSEYVYTGVNQWNWFDPYPQTVGKNARGENEHISVSAAGHANSDTSRSYVGDGGALSAQNADFGFSLTTTGEGLFFQQQWEYALQVDPMVITITGWNEFSVGAQSNLGEGQVMAGTYHVNFSDPQYDRHYIDLFNTEFSRDIEPINGFFNDNYYYQMASYIRKFKGTAAVPCAEGGRDIDLSAPYEEQWADVGPLFCDTVGDITHRDSPSLENVYRYVNTTGRNDIVSVKVSKENGYTAFLITCAEELVYGAEGVAGRAGIDFKEPEDGALQTFVNASEGDVSEAGSNWMNLLIDSDQNADTGWEGYDYILNRSRDGKTVSVERFLYNSWEFERVGQAEYVIDGENLIIRVADSLVGLEGRDQFDFKAADNSVADGDVLKFMTLGDAAPDNRFNFLYIKQSGGSGGHGEGVSAAVFKGIGICAGILILAGLCVAAVKACVAKRKK